MKVLVFGSTGQLGTDVVRVFMRRGEDVLPVTRELADLTDRTAVAALLARERPDAVVNCAAFHDPAGCEEDPELAFAVNASGVEVLAQHCAEIPAKLMTVSTDYVFDGAKVGGYREDDTPNPLNRYGEPAVGIERLRANPGDPRHDVVVVQLGHVGAGGGDESPLAQRPGHLPDAGAPVGGGRSAETRVCVPPRSSRGR